MPAALESCVEELLEKGHEKESAWAICTKSLRDSDCFAKDSCCMIPGVMTQDNVKRRYFVDSIVPGAFSETPEGYLVFENAKLARAGVQEYYGFELGLTDGEQAFSKVRVLRPETEVFKPGSMKWIAVRPVTLCRPKEML